MKILTITDYGIYIMSPLIMDSFLKSENIKSNKLLNYFQKNHDKYLLSLKYGIWIPVLPIDSISYFISLDTDIFDKSWEKSFEYGPFNLEVGADNSIWIGSFGNLLTWKRKEYTNTKDNLAYTTWDDKIYHKAFRFEKNSGKYNVTISGYRKKQDLSQINRGFLFTLVEVKDFVDYNDPREDDKYYFNKFVLP